MIKFVHVETIGVAVDTRSETDEESDPEIERHVTRFESAKDRERAFFDEREKLVWRVCLREKKCDKEGIDEADTPRDEKWHGIPPLYEKSSQKWTDDKCEPKHHTKNAIILCTLFFIF